MTSLYLQREIYDKENSKTILPNILNRGHFHTGSGIADELTSQSALFTEQGATFVKNRLSAFVNTVMKLLVTGVLCTWMLLLSCEKSAHRTKAFTGNYTGTFERRAGVAGPVSNVTITFNNGIWIGQSQTAKYPALCNGTYQVSGTDSIQFINACVWTAEFDGTLILSGNYKYEENGNTLLLTRTRNNYTDIYTLTK